MKGKLLVSVVVPTFNSEGSLEECFGSVKKQIYSTRSDTCARNASHENL